jgi:hypothetical protein
MVSSLGTPDIFFDGWNRHIRNSIAHCRFRYLEDKGEMLFSDINPKGRTVYERRWTLEKFSELSLNVQDVWFILLNLLYLLRTRQLLLAPYVPRAGEDLIMPTLSRKF